MSDKESNSNGSILTITAEIISQEPEGFIIKIYNDERKETFEATSVREYAEYLIRSVNSSMRDNFQAIWKPSPKARRYDIDLIGMQLSMMEEWMEKELKEATAPDIEDDGGLMEAMEAMKKQE